MILLYRRLLKARHVKAYTRARAQGQLGLPIFVGEHSDVRPPAQPKAAGKAEPWRQTREEFIAASTKRLAATTAAAGKPTFYLDGAGFGTHGEFRMTARFAHESHVKRALGEGRPVPAEVLKDYPHLRPEPKMKAAVRVVGPHPEKQIAMLFAEQAPPPPGLLFDPGPAERPIGPVLAGPLWSKASRLRWALGDTGFYIQHVGRSGVHRPYFGVDPEGYTIYADNGAAFAHLDDAKVVVERYAMDPEKETRAADVRATIRGENKAAHHAEVVTRREERKAKRRAEQAPPPQVEERGGYYVSAVDPQNPKKKNWLMAGPFNTHQEALDRVEEVRRLAGRLDFRSDFMAFGTARVRQGDFRPGKLNAEMGLPPHAPPMPEGSDTRPVQPVAFTVGPKERKRQREESEQEEGWRLQTEGYVRATENPEGATEKDINLALQQLGHMFRREADKEPAARSNDLLNSINIEEANFRRILKRRKVEASEREYRDYKARQKKPARER